MNKQVKDALTATICGFYNGNQQEKKVTCDSDAAKTILHQTEKIFDADKDFLSKVKELDVLWDQNPAFENIREFCFDLLMIHFFAEDSIKLGEDYLESAEWEKIENQTLDRGTEILNLFLYLQECEEEKIIPELEDFLSEFLLVEEDEFQDEHEIYEDIIANQMLMESTISEIASCAHKLQDNSPVKDIFYPLMCFFYSPEFSEKTLQEMQKNSKNKAYDTALIAALYAFHKGLGVFPKSFINFVA